jgi:hypothetical protein
VFIKFTCPIARRVLGKEYVPIMILVGERRRGSHPLIPLWIGFEIGKEDSSLIRREASYPIATGRFDPLEDEVIYKSPHLDMQRILESDQMTYHWLRHKNSGIEIDYENHYQVIEVIDNQELLGELPNLSFLE